MLQRLKINLLSQYLLYKNANTKLTQAQIDNNLKTLNRIADILKKFKDYKVTIVGHANKVTDNPDEETVDDYVMCCFYKIKHCGLKTS